MEKKVFFVDICNSLADVNRQLNAMGFQTSVYPSYVPAEVFTEELFRQAKPIWPVVNMVKRLAERYTIVYLTARPEGMRQVTLEWLKAYALPAGPVIHTGGRLKGDMARELVHLDWIAGAIEDSPHEIEGYAKAIPGIRLLISWKQEINIGHVNNQNFVQIPFWKLRRFLAYLCEKNGIEYVEVTESYTSKASFLDRDELPEYDPECKPVFSGKRVKRGLYRSRNGQKINADLNGAANILRKACLDANLTRVNQVLCLNPVKLYPLATVKKRTLKSKAAA